MKKTVFIVMIIIFLFISTPFIIFAAQKPSSLNVWIIDKTVPTKDFREHKGLVWILNNMKIKNALTQEYFDYTRDYFGFYPQDDAYDIFPIEPNNPDLIYIADTYGVYTDDFNKLNAEGTKSNLIYGGLSEAEWFQIKSYLNNGRTVVAEFNTIEYPTGEKVRKEMEDVFGFEWSGWIGRYFARLEKEMEVPLWVIKAYEEQYQRKWDFKGNGFVFISQNNEIIVLDQNDFKNKKMYVDFKDEYINQFKARDKVNYYYWFEITEDKGAEVLANFVLDLNESGREKLNKHNIKASFPAIYKNKNDDYTAYYFAGDFVDINDIPRFYNMAGYDKFKKLITMNIDASQEAFFWKVYVPVMKKIIRDVEKIPAKGGGEIFEINGTKLVSRINGNKLEIYKKGKWQPVFIKGVNMGFALPGKWFTQMPEDEMEYLKWFDLIGKMNANTIRVYTLIHPSFYSALKTYNQIHADNPLYLIQEIWPDENPKDHNYLDKENMENFMQEIEYVVDAIHGNINIPERRGKSFGEYKADVSKWTIAFLVGRELEPDEVISTNEKNKGYIYKGKYISSTKGEATEAWLAKSCDYVMDYEDTKYKMQHPVAIVSWPTLDPIVHRSEFNEYGKKELEYNDKVSIDINNFDLGEKNMAGFFGAYHIYPNYPDFMNNEEHYKNYKDDKGRLMYGGYLKEFISQHQKFPALVAEFGLATGMGNAHENPDGYNHGGLDEVMQGEGIVRMMKAIKAEGYLGGIIFEWMDEWAKKTWITEPFMIPYERHVLWHNAIDPEQNYGILAYESIKPEKADMVLEDDGIIKKIEISSDVSYLYLDIEYDKNVDINSKEIIIGIDTYDRNRGDFKYDPKLDIKAPSGMEFIIKLNKNSAKLLAHPDYNIGNFKFSSKKTDNGIFEEIRPIINKSRITMDGKIIPEIRQDGSTLRYGDFSDSSQNYYIDDKIHIRIPWARLNVTDPSSHRVLDDARKFNSFPARDEFKTVVTEGFVISGVVLSNGKIEDVFPGKQNIDLKIFKWKGWEDPVYKERLKKSYEIIKKYFQELN
ncbi:hypothetical protein SAMN02745221_01784 [Thermosyntropha lipolytica DSM 11003]|uniref:Uncharacterized protein n=1 Tax=Thermosyntropha lipolytica DSM 11003 TaxID=1123382 RepID=A0A1M5QJN9_9FIRM|nr:hypothetical protein [Thermosyntropha lipolytica]SHH14322.1 hypothetical protein SAMN02745221_01784 [Thermosyntropha lipolytica DSM 11003]